MEEPNLTENQQRELWFIRLRWVTIILITVILFFLKHMQGAAFPLLPSFLLIIFFVVFNTVYAILALYYKPFSEDVFFNYFRASVDILLVTLFVHLTGGIESPFILLYLPELVMISMFSSGAFAYLLAGQAAAFFILNCVLEANLLIPHYHLSYPPAALYLNFSHITSISVALLFVGILLVYLSSYLSGKFIEKQNKVEELSNAQATFMNLIMHETKSPLTSIIGYTQALSKESFGKLTEDQKEPLAVIRRQSQRILNMTNDLLGLARLESGVVKIAKNPTSPADVLERAIEEMKPLQNGKKLDLIKEISPELPLVPMEEDKVIQVITNLLSNAIKFSKPKGRIFISTQLLDKQVQVSIRDEGLGIDPQDLPHIFEKFYRSSKEAAAVRGTGLGLALSKGIIEAHGGRLWAVSSGRDKGAVFHFTLPL
jgi:signal transduction histidine kinase